MQAESEYGCCMADAPLKQGAYLGVSDAKSGLAVAREMLNV
jgi:hypothetical protein